MVGVFFFLVKDWKHTTRCVIWEIRGVFRMRVFHSKYDLIWRIHVWPSCFLEFNREFVFPSAASHSRSTYLSRQMWAVMRQQQTSVEWMKRFMSSVWQSMTKHQKQGSKYNLLQTLAQTCAALEKNMILSDANPQQWPKYMRWSSIDYRGRGGGGDHRAVFELKVLEKKKSGNMTPV